MGGVFSKVAAKQHRKGSLQDDYFLDCFAFSGIFFVPDVIGVACIAMATVVKAVQKNKNCLKNAAFTPLLLLARIH